MFSDRDPPEPQSQFRVMILLKKSFILLVAAFSAGPPRVYEHCYVFFGIQTEALGVQTQGLRIQTQGLRM